MLTTSFQQQKLADQRVKKTFSCNCLAISHSKGRSRIMFLVFSNMESTVSGNDERWSSDKPGAVNLCALQNLGEIPGCNKMQVAALQLQSCSSREKPFKLLKSPASICKHKDGDGLRFLGGIGEGLRGTDAMKEQKREMHRLMNGENLPPESRASSSNELVEISPTNSSGANNCSDSSESKQVKQVSEAGKIKKLSERLKILEEETGPLKQEIFQHMEERKKVVAEIYQQFQTIHHRLQFENQVREEGSPHDGSSIVKFLKVHNLSSLFQTLENSWNPLLRRSINYELIMMQMVSTRKQDWEWQVRSPTLIAKSMHCLEVFAGKDL
ncbi:hypothetical protein DKX38_003853 [Salix brachista]|uniref:Uncharacterized protein n=1 Tax=Salix brachista TaxID=2182728 RepID=A0A5N5N9C4_9ROSI|nr:hypothetical protein DKX38_003853 [Salix brachista]